MLSDGELSLPSSSSMLGLLIPLSPSSWQPRISPPSPWFRLFQDVITLEPYRLQPFQIGFFLSVATATVPPCLFPVRWLISCSCWILSAGVLPQTVHPLSADWGCLLHPRRRGHGHGSLFLGSFVMVAVPVAFLPLPSLNMLQGGTGPQSFPSRSVPTDLSRPQPMRSLRGTRFRRHRLLS